MVVIKRGKAPSKGNWSFPGGTQELGESLAECAVREIREECNLELRFDRTAYHRLGDTLGYHYDPVGQSEQDDGSASEGEWAGSGPSGLLRSAYVVGRPPQWKPQELTFPVPYAAVDTIVKDAEGRLQFHYTIVEVAAAPVDPTLHPVAADDVDEARWIPVRDLPLLANLNRHCARLGLEAAARFRPPSEPAVPSGTRPGGDA